MVKEITLPIRSETCDKISEVLLHFWLLSGIPALCIGAYYVLNTNGTTQLLFAGLGVYGLFMTLLCVSCYGEDLSNFYNNHKIVFKCSCDKPKTEGVK